MSFEETFISAPFQKRSVSHITSDPADPDSVPKDLSVRRHMCLHSGLDMDRDLNAAGNILTLGMQGIQPQS